MNELQYQDISTYLCAWYKGGKNDSPIELGVWPWTNFRHSHSFPHTYPYCTSQLCCLQVQ